MTMDKAEYIERMANRGWQLRVRGGEYVVLTYDEDIDGDVVVGDSDGDLRVPSFEALRPRLDALMAPCIYWSLCPHPEIGTGTGEWLEHEGVAPLQVEDESEEPPRNLAAIVSDSIVLVVEYRTVTDEGTIESHEERLAVAGMRTWADVVAAAVRWLGARQGDGTPLGWYLLHHHYLDQLDETGPGVFNLGLGC